MHTFEAGKGINCNKLNENFTEVAQDANANEKQLNRIESTTLKKDGSNLTQEIVDDFNKSEPVVLSARGTIALEDNKTYFLTLTGGANISLPTIQDDIYSHTIAVTVQGSSYVLDLGTEYHLLQLDIDRTEPYSVLYTYNKIDKHWYYAVTQ